MQGVEIVNVSDRRGWNEFVDLPWRIYSGDPNWVPPIKKFVRRLLDPAKHPFWKFSKRALFLAKRGSQTVGRIAGIVDDNYNQYHREKSGAWGFFECDNDHEAAAALFSAVEEWVGAQGMTFLRGPLNPSTNYEVGMLIQGFERPPTFMMTYNPPYYVSLAETYGFYKEKDLLAMVVTRATGAEMRVMLNRTAQRIVEKENVRIRNANIKDFRAEIALMKDLYEAAWSRNWGFVPMSADELVEMGENLVRIIDPDLLFFVYYSEEPVGFCVIVPDINPVLKRLNGKLGILGMLKASLLYRNEIKGLRGLLFGFKPTHRQLGLPLVAFDWLNRLHMQKTQYEYLELGWNLEDNHDIIQFQIDLGARVYKRYRIFGKPVGTGNGSDFD
ncbi:MAG: acyl-CoA N-acyltransferase [Desulfomonile tiedjei]|nr:acyl-CoA N-acyltransferase [Desulfomonile tiedjei]